MALFRDKKYEELENEFTEGKVFQNEHHTFTLTLDPIVPFPTRILDYEWIVKLSNEKKFNTKMGPTLIYPRTRLEHIINNLKELNEYHNDYLANAINDEIDSIFMRYN